MRTEMVERNGGNSRLENTGSSEQGFGQEAAAPGAAVSETGAAETGAAERAAAGTGEKPFGWKGILLYYVGYTALFCLMAAAVFVWFWLRKRRFVWQNDGINQHYYGLLYFSRWGKEVLRQFRETGVLRLPTFSLRMGYGEDLYTTLAYYVIGDPFSLPSIFVPEKYMLAFHDVMLLVRFYLAGIAFSAYSFFMGKKSRIGILAGTMVYVFNGFTLSGMRHHYFLNPFILFPLLLIGCEQIFRKKKPGLFIFMVFLSAVSNFYFFYMIVLMTVLYVVWRSLRLRGLRHFGRVLLDALTFVWYGLLGILLSAFIFLPVVLRFLQDPRTTEAGRIPVLWPLTYYQNFIDSWMTNSSAALAESWTYMGFGAVAAFCVLFVFSQRKKHFDLKAAFVGLTALLLTPAAGFVLNGFSYPANRWMFAYALLIGTMTAATVTELAEAGVRQFAASLVLLAAAAAACIGWHYTFSRETAQAVIIALFGLAAVLLCRVAMREAEQKLCENGTGGSDEENVEGADGTEGRQSGIAKSRYHFAVRAQAAMLVCVLVTIVSAGYFSFSPSKNARIFEYLSRAQIDLQMSADGMAAAKLLDGRQMSVDGNLAASEDAGDGYAKEVPFYRYTTFDPQNNTSILYGVSNTQYYWSLSNPDVSRFLDETGQLNRMIHQYDTLDERTALNEIAGVRYFLSDTPNGVPFGYDKVEGLSYSNADIWPENDTEERFSYEVYENRYALPFGFTSGRWISRPDYEAMDIPQRQQALLQGIVLEKDPGDGLTRLTATGGEEGSAKLEMSDCRIESKIEYDTAKITDANLDTSGGQPLRFEAAEGDGTVTVRFAGMPDCETALYIRGFHYAPPAGRLGASRILMSVRGYTGDKQLLSKQIGHTTGRNHWSTGRTDYLVNMRYRQEALDTIRITLPAPGTYTFDSIEVVCQPMTQYTSQVQELGREVMTGLDIHELGGSGATEKITGQVTVSEPRLLCLQIPCTAGWAAYVDGVRTELLQADTMFSALPLTAGTHEIELRYQTPGLRIGAVISVGTLIVLLLFMVIYVIVSAILHAAERRRESIPVGTYENVGETAAEAEPAEEAAEDLTEAPAEAGGEFFAGDLEEGPAEEGPVKANKEAGSVEADRSKETAAPARTGDALFAEDPEKGTAEEAPAEANEVSIPEDPEEAADSPVDIPERQEKP